MDLKSPMEWDFSTSLKVFLRALQNFPTCLILKNIKKGRMDGKDLAVPKISLRSPVSLGGCSQRKMSSVSSLSPLFMFPDSSGQTARPGHAGTLMLLLRMSQRILESEPIRAGNQSLSELLSERGEHRHVRTTQVRSPIVQNLGWSPCSWDSLVL